MPPVARLVCATAAFGALVAGLIAAPAAGGAAADRDWPCRAKNLQVVAASDAARIVMVPGQSGVWGCASPLRTGDGAVWLTEASVGDFGGVDLQLAGRFAAYRSIGDGCGDGDCIGPVAYAVDLHDGRELGADGIPRRRHREFRGAVDIVLFRDGRVVTIEAPGPAIGEAASRPERVVLRTRDGRARSLARGPGIEAGSLMTFGRHVQWRRDGRLQAARVLPR